MRSATWIPGMSIKYIHAWCLLNGQSPAIEGQEKDAVIHSACLQRATNREQFAQTAMRERESLQRDDPAKYAPLLHS